MVIVDAQSVKNTDSAREKGYDGGKKVSGIKRHIAVDTNGLPHGIEVTTANVTDRDGALLLAKQSKDILSNVEKMLVDGGYSGEHFAYAIKKAIGATVEVVKRNELHTFTVLPKRSRGRAVIRLVGEVPEVVEELREKTLHQSSDDHTGVHFFALAEDMRDRG